MIEALLIKISWVGLICFNKSFRGGCRKNNFIWVEQK